MATPHIRGNAQNMDVSCGWTSDFQNHQRLVIIKSDADKLTLSTRVPILVAYHSTHLF